MSKSRWVGQPVLWNEEIVMLDSEGRLYAIMDGESVIRLPDPPPLAAEVPAPRQPLTEWPGPGEEPAGLWVFERNKIVGQLRGRFVLVPDSSRALWACSGYSLRSGDFEPGDRFIPVED